MMSTCREQKNKRGGGFLNTIINKLPLELHIPGGYQYCGPGTNLEKRIARGDSGINLLDRACKEHDIAYSKYSTLDDRHHADAKLRDAALKRVQSKNASFGEKISAWTVAKAMGAKIKLGMGLHRGRLILNDTANSTIRKKTLKKQIHKNRKKKGALKKRKTNKK